MSLFMALNGTERVVRRGLLLGVERTSLSRGPTSENDRNGHSTAFYALRGLAPLGTTADSWVIRTMMASTVLNQMPQSTRARRQALLLITLMASVPQALNARLCVGANPYIGSRRVFDDR